MIAAYVLYSRPLIALPNLLFNHKSGSADSFHFALAFSEVLIESNNGFDAEEEIVYTIVFVR